MSWDGFLAPPNTVPCKACGKMLNADGYHPAETYAGTATGLCNACMNCGPFVKLRYTLDGATLVDCPPSCPSHRRDRNDHHAYPDCPHCRGFGYTMVSRHCSQGGSYASFCRECLDRFLQHPARQPYYREVEELARAIYAERDEWDRYYKGLLRRYGLVLHSPGADAVARVVLTHYDRNRHSREAAILARYPGIFDFEEFGWGEKKVEGQVKWV